MFISGLNPWLLSSLSPLDDAIGTCGSTSILILSADDITDPIPASWFLAGGPGFADCENVCDRFWTGKLECLSMDDSE